MKERRDDREDVCRVHVPPSPFPVDAHVVVERRGQIERKTAFYAGGDGTREITDDSERRRFIGGRWGSGAAAAGDAA